MEFFAFSRAVIQRHVETTRHRNHKLLKSFVCVPRACRASRNVVKVVNPHYRKRDMALLNEGKISPRVANLREIQNRSNLNHCFLAEDY